VAQILDFNTPSVAPAGAPGNDYLRINANPNMFGAQTAQAVEKLGGAFEKAGNDVTQIAEFQNRIDVDDQHNQFNDVLNKTLYGDPNKKSIGPDGQPTVDTGFMGLEGRAASDARDGTLKALEEARLAGRNNLKNPMAQLAYDNQTRRTYQEAESRIGAHTNQQWKTWAGGVNAAGASHELNDYVNAIGDPAKMEALQHNYINFRVQQAQIKFGNDPNTNAEAERQAKLELLEAHVNAVAVRDPDRAIQILDSNKTTAGVKYDDMYNRLRDRADAQVGAKVGEDAWNKSGEGLSGRAAGVRTDAAQALRQQGVPLNVTSEYRSPERNAAVGGARGSQHLHGNAIDVSLTGLSPEQQQMVVNQFLSDPRVGGFGYYPRSNSIHVDVRQGGRAAWGTDYHGTSVGEGWPSWLTQQVRAWQGGGGASAAPAGGAPSSLLDQARQQYPILNKEEIQYKVSPGRSDSNMLESWPPDEPGDENYKRPGEFPLDKFGIEVFSEKTRPIDILADVVSHRLINTDPKIKEFYSDFKNSITPHQEEILRDQYEHAKEHEGEKRPYEQWKEMTGLPAFFRGYPFQQWPDDFNKRAYTPEQLKKLDAMMDYLRGHEGGAVAPPASSLSMPNTLPSAVAPTWEEKKASALRELINDPSLRDRPKAFATAWAEVEKRAQIEHATAIDTDRAEKAAEKARKQQSLAVEDEYLKDAYDANPQKTAVDVVNDPRLQNDPETRKKIIAFQERANKPDPMAPISQKTTRQLFDRMRLPAGDPNKITDLGPINQAFSDGKLTRADHDWVTSQFKNSETPDGERLGKRKTEFLKGVAPQIDQTDMNLGIKDLTGQERLYRFEWDLDHLMEQDRKADKNPWNRLDPTKPEYMGRAEALAPYRKTTEQIMAEWGTNHPAPAATPEQPGFFSRMFSSAPAPATPAPATAGAPAAAAPSAQFNPAAVRNLGELQSAFGSGRLSREQAMQIAVERGWAVRKPAAPPPAEPPAMHVPLSQ
jgi:hypothetical protein